MVFGMIVVLIGIPWSIHEAAKDADPSKQSDRNGKVLVALPKVVGSVIFSISTVALAMAFLIAIAGDEGSAYRVIGWLSLIVLSICAGTSSFYSVRMVWKTVVARDSASPSLFWGKPAFMIAATVGMIALAIWLEDWFSFSVDEEPLILLGVVSFFTSFFIHVSSSR